MSLFNDDAMVEKAQQRTSFRLTNVSSKLSQSEAERLDLLAKKRGQQRVFNDDDGVVHDESGALPLDREPSAHHAW